MRKLVILQHLASFIIKQQSAGDESVKQLIDGLNEYTNKALSKVKDAL